MPKVSELDPASPLTGAEMIPVTQGGTSYEVSLEDGLVLGGGGVSRIVALTQVAYDALGAPNATTLYVIIP